MSGLFGSAIIEVLIGLFFLYWLLSIICSAIQEMLAALLKLRAGDLERGLQNLVCDPAVYAQIMAHPVIKSIGNTDAEHQLVRLFARSKAGIPSYVSSRAFSLALLDYLAPVTSTTTLTLEALRTKALAMTAPQGTSAGLRDLGKLLLTLIDREVPLRVAAALPGVVDDKVGGAIDAAQRDLTAFRASLESWFDEAMEHVSGVYKRRAKTWIFVTALLIAVPVGADTLRFASTLYTTPTLRDVLVADAAKAVAATPTPVPGTTAAPVPTPTVAETVAQNYQNAEAAGEELKKFSQLFGFDDRPSTSDVGQWAGFLTKRIFGSLLTAFAISMGAPFWFDIMSKLVSLRSSGNKQTTADTKSAE